MREVFFAMMLGCVCAINVLVGLAHVPQRSPVVNAPVVPAMQSHPADADVQVQTAAR